MRITQRAKRLGATSEDKQRLLVRIGVKLQGAMVMNATRENLVRSGALRQSLKFNVSGDSVEVGSYGVPYARHHEFGARLSARGLSKARRWFFAQLKSGQRIPIKGAGNFSLKTGIVKKRSFVRPAFEKNKAWIMQQIKDYLDGN